jgi:tetratricopeptide repeat protein 30
MSSLSVQQQEQLQGKFTSVIYSLIRDQQYGDAVEILQLLVQDFPRSRAALSLLAYCQYFAQDFFGAATSYETLVQVFPDVEGYKVHYAQSLYKAGMFAEALQASLAVSDDPQHRGRTLQLQASIKFAQDELAGCRSLVDRCDQDDADVGIFRACILFKEGKFDEAQRGFEEATQALGYRPHLTYNLGLCHYEQQNYADALRSIGVIIERGVNDHPELSVGSNSGEHTVQSVGNSQLLAMTALVEAFNLKAAIEYRLENSSIAQSALNNMPPRREEELDPITLHNQALMNFDKEPQAALRKLNWLIANPPFPPPTFQNLLLLYIENKCHTLAADVLADNAHLTFECLSQPMYDFIDAHLMSVSDPAEAFRRFEGLKQKHVATLRARTKMISDARSTGVKDEVKKALNAYDRTLEEYIPCLMAQAHIYWERGNYLQVENIFRQSAEFCSEHEKWKLNVAHTFFMQEQDKFAEALRYYEPFVQQFDESICDVQVRTRH